MTDKEKIRQEIERRITDNTFGAKLELIDILAWLDTLSEDLDKSLEEAANNHIRKVVDAAGHPGWDWTTQDIMDAFKAGAEWQKEKMLKEAVEGEVEELYNDGESQCTVGVGTYFKPGEKVYILKAEEERK